LPTSKNQHIMHHFKDFADKIPHFKPGSCTPSPGTTTRAVTQPTPDLPNFAAICQSHRPYLDGNSLIFKSAISGPPFQVRPKTALLHQPQDALPRRARTFAHGQGQEGTERQGEPAEIAPNSQKMPPPPLLLPPGQARTQHPPPPTAEIL